MVRRHKDVGTRAKQKRRAKGCSSMWTGIVAHRIWKEAKTRGR